jgi:hypothetical protein
MNKSNTNVKNSFVNAKNIIPNNSIMKNTQLNLTDATSDRLLLILNNVSAKDRDVIWGQLYRDVKKAKDIWVYISKKNQKAKSKI